MKFSVFLMEQIMAIAFFALTAAVCVQLFVSSNNMADDSADLNYALVVAQNGAEAYKSSQGDLDTTAAVIAAAVCEAEGSPMIVISYDDNWNVCGAAQAKYEMYISAALAPADDLRAGLVSVKKVSGRDRGKTIFELPVTAREVQP